MFRLLRFLNGTITFAISLVLVLCMVYAGYALWDNEKILAEAENVKIEFSEIRSQMEDSTEDDLKTSFEKLQAINPDVCAWIVMPNTGIDYPVVQGETNMSYLSHDVNKEFSMAGSIFLDFRNNRDYSDVYSLLYGHNMSRNRMFSDVNHYKEEEFFRENTLGMLMLPESAHVLKSISVILTSASNSDMMNPTSWSYMTQEEWIPLIQEQSMYICEEGMAALQAKMDKGEQPHIVALSTCSPEYEDARTILLTLMDP